MKRILTALAICSLLLATGTAVATVFTWDGDTSLAWDTPHNWNQGSSYPGQLYPFRNDDAIIDRSINNPPSYYPQLQGDVTINSLTMRDGGDTSSAVTLEIVTNVSLTIGGALNVTEGTTDDGSYVEFHGAGSTLASTCTVTGGSDSGDDVTLEIASGTLSTSGLFTIQDSTSAAYAELWVTSTGTVSPDSMEMDGDARMVLDSDMSVTNQFKVTDGYDRVQSGSIYLSEDVTLSCGSILVEGGANGVSLEPTFESGSSIVTN